MQIVNGYVSQTGCDVAAAKKGHYPKNPHDDPIKAEALAEQKALTTGKTDQATGATATQTAFAVEAVRFGGSLSSLTPRGSGAGATQQLVDLTA